MRQIEKQKKSKKNIAPSYLNYQSKVFYLDQMLDHTYWNFHSSMILTKFVPYIFGQRNEFIALDSGAPVKHLTWVNEIDQASPYKTGYLDKVWVVSGSRILIFLVHSRKYYCQQKYQEVPN